MAETMFMEEFIEALAKAMAKEFAFMESAGIVANNEAWRKAALGVADKMGVEYYGEGHGPTRYTIGNSA